MQLANLLLLGSRKRDRVERSGGHKETPFLSRLLRQELLYETNETTAINKITAPIVGAPLFYHLLSYQYLNGGAKELVRVAPYRRPAICIAICECKQSAVPSQRRNNQSVVLLRVPLLRPDGVQTSL